MAFDKSLPNTGPFEDPMLNGPYESVDPSVDIPPDEPSGYVELSDGSVEIEIGPAPVAIHDDHGANLAEYLDESQLLTISTTLREKIDSDLRSREEWEKLGRDGLKLLGFQHEERTKPFAGACGVSHPILAEAVVRFQSQALTEAFPASGPVRTKVVGKHTPGLAAQARRVQEYMNYVTTELMEDYREEHDRLLFCLPLMGSAFKKLRHDPLDERPVAEFIEPDDLIVPYGTTTLKKAVRITHRLRNVDKVWIQKMQEVGFYRSCELTSSIPEADSLLDEKDNVSGSTKYGTEPDVHTLYECHTYLQIEDMLAGGEPDEDAGEYPYIVTFDKDSGKVLSIRRGWEEEDPKRRRTEHFVDYKYVPGIGFYAFGLAHLIGGLATGSTSILRQLVDAGTFSNLPGGFKAKGARVSADKTPIAPGEWRDIDLGVIGQNLKDNIFPLPYKEPSPTLFELMKLIIEEGRRFASLTDMNISNVNQEAPVGTTLALIERSMKVMTAIQSRLHASMKRELKILARLIRDHGPDEYPFPVDPEDARISEDFDDRVDVIPVSDPNSSTQSQRIMQAQAALQIATIGSPDGIDFKRLKRYALDVMGVPDANEILPMEEDIRPMDPVSENMNILTLSPVKAFQHQDHDAHIQVHMLAMQDPGAEKILSSSPSAPAMVSAMMAHVTEHLAMKYRNDIERNLGVPLPPPGEELPPDIENELSRLTAQAADKLFRESQRSHEAKLLEEQMNDPIVQAKFKELQLKEVKTVSDAEEKDRRFQLDLIKELRSGEQKERQLDQDYELGTGRIRVQALAEVLFGLSRMEEITHEDQRKVVEMVMSILKREQAEARARVTEKKPSEGSGDGRGGGAE